MHNGSRTRRCFGFVAGISLLLLGLHLGYEQSADFRLDTGIWEIAQCLGISILVLAGLALAVINAYLDW